MANKTLKTTTKKTPKKKETTTLISIVLDSSGSMQICLSATIEGFNSFVNSQRDLPGKALLSLNTFNSTVHKVYSHMPIEEIPLLHSENYRPVGNTALLDAVGESIRSMDAYLNTIEKPDQVLMLIITDGEENASRKYDNYLIKNLTKAKESEGWTFAYIGANQDSFANARELGISSGNTMSFNSTDSGTREMYSATLGSTKSYRLSGVSGQSVDNFFGNK